MHEPPAPVELAHEVQQRLGRKDGLAEASTRGAAHAGREVDDAIGPAQAVGEQRGLGAQVGAHDLDAGPPQLGLQGPRRPHDGGHAVAALQQLGDRVAPDEAVGSGHDHAHDRSDPTMRRSRTTSLTASISEWLTGDGPPAIAAS